MILHQCTLSAMAAELSSYWSYHTVDDNTHKIGSAFRSTDDFIKVPVKIAQLCNVELHNTIPLNY